MEVFDLYARLWSHRSAWVIGAIIVLTLVAALLFGRRDLVSGRALANSGVSLAFFLANFLLVPLMVLLKMSLVALYAAIDLPQLAPAVWAGLPFALVVLVAWIADEVWLYWVHRWLHSRWGWPIHAIHHSDSHVNGLTLWRVHILEVVVMRVFAIAMVSWLGLPPEAVGASAGLAIVHGAYVHAPLDWEHGPFRMLLASPRFHRWHHYDAAPAYTTNLANALPLLDRIFGTYCAPRRLDAPLGAATAGVPDTDFVALWLWPFREWGRMLGLARVRGEAAP